MSGEIATQPPIEIFVQQKTHSGDSECVFPSFFQQNDDLFAFHARKSFEELLDRIARLQVVEKTFHRNTGPDKDRLAAEDIRILRYDFAHQLECNSKQLIVPAAEGGRWLKCQSPPA